MSRILGRVLLVALAMIAARPDAALGQEGPMPGADALPAAASSVEASPPSDPAGSPEVYGTPEAMRRWLARRSIAPGSRSSVGRPDSLRRPVDAEASPERPPSVFDVPPYPRLPMDPPSGFSGRSGVRAAEPQASGHFVPVEDRWRIGYSDWDRYGTGHPILDESPYTPGRWFDPYNLNKFKGDYPIIGQHTFLDVNFLSIVNLEGRELPTQTSAFESTSSPFQGNPFGRPNSFFTLDFFALIVDLVHGDAGFKQPDWRIRLAPTLGVSNFSFSALQQVDPNVLEGSTLTRTFWALEEGFFEYRLADIGPDYDFASVRLGNQLFNADFRGFLFFDINRAVRFFGTRHANRDQWNLAYFRQWNKDTNTGLNTFHDRGQNLIFANYYRQDFIFPGYTAQVSMNFNNDPSSVRFNKNRLLVRPDPVGNFQPHEVDVAYLGWGGDGHIGRYNITHQFYWAFGHDSMNPLANRAQTINAQMAAIEGSYNRGWARFRASFFWASGDGNPNDTHANGFDSILDAPIFAGGPFSFWNRQSIPLQGVNMVQRLSLVPDLRSSKIQGQANFVNPGLLLPTLGADFDLTPKLKLITNANFLWFDKTASLQQFLYQGNINRFIGVDLAVGAEYRPLAIDNVLFVGGVSVLIPGQGFLDMYNNFDNRVGTLVAGFLTSVVAF